MYTEDIMSFFPLPQARRGQTLVINEIDKVFKSGKKIVILEGPVGCGKSAIAMTFANAFGDAHMITPRKSLQNQYFEDFESDIVLMKGRGAYPCTYQKPVAKYNKVIASIKNGQVKQPDYSEVNCSKGPCKGDLDVFSKCTEGDRPCPYTVAIEVAQENKVIVHNVHSFIFQASFTDRFPPRTLMVIDEVHTIEGIIREFISKKITVEGKDLSSQGSSSFDIPTGSDLDVWCNYLTQPELCPKESELEIRAKAADPDKLTGKDLYLQQVSSLYRALEYLKGRFVVKTSYNRDMRGRVISTSFEFVPEYLGNSPSSLLFEYGEYVLLMSGTIYGKETFCKNLGIDMEAAHYIRIPSTFPSENRPIYAVQDFQVDTSFTNWEENFDEMICKIEKIMNIFKDAKGLIHSPSYDTGEKISIALINRGHQRVVCHNKQDFQEKLTEFFDSEGNEVFISPVCSEGVDFKEDRARFQIILRVPYSSTSDEFIKHKVENDFSWYNYQALLTFGQQLGRVNRSEDDFGATFLLDSRFNRFITKNLKLIPKWVQNAIKWK